MKLADETLLNWNPYRVPATPARPALRAKASILVRGTFTPAAAAARSLARTDRNRRPVPERRMLATNQHAPTSRTRQKIMKGGLLVRPPSPVDPMSSPNSDGFFTSAGAPARRPVSWSFSK